MPIVRKNSRRVTINNFRTFFERNHITIQDEVQNNYMKIEDRMTNECFLFFNYDHFSTDIQNNEISLKIGIYELVKEICEGVIIEGFGQTTIIVKSVYLKPKFYQLDYESETIKIYPIFKLENILSHFEDFTKHLSIATLRIYQFRANIVESDYLEIRNFLETILNRFDNFNRKQKSLLKLCINKLLIVEKNYDLKLEKIFKMGDKDLGEIISEEMIMEYVEKEFLYRNIDRIISMTAAMGNLERIL